MAQKSLNTKTRYLFLNCLGFSIFIALFFGFLFVGLPLDKQLDFLLRFSFPFSIGSYPLHTIVLYWPFLLIIYILLFLDDILPGNASNASFFWIGFSMTFLSFISIFFQHFLRDRIPQKRQFIFVMLSWTFRILLFFTGFILLILPFLARLPVH